MSGKKTDAAEARATGRKAEERFLKGRLAGGRRYIYAAVLAGLGVTLCSILQAFAFASVIFLVVIEGTGVEDVSGWFLAFGGAMILKALLSYLSEYQGTVGALAVQRILRGEILGRLFSENGAVRLPVAPSATALIEQVDKLEGYYARYQPLMLLAAFSPLLMLAFIFPANWVVGLILLFSAPLIPLYMALVGMGAETESRKQFESLRRLSGYFLDRLQGLQTLKRLGYATREMDNVAEASEELQDRTMSVLRVAFLSSTVLEFFATFSIAVVATYVGLGLLGWTSFGIGSEGMTLRTGLFVLLLAPIYFQPLRSFAAAYHDRADAIAAVADLSPLVAGVEVDAEEKPEKVPSGGLLLQSIERIELRGATVDYSGRKNAALQDIDLEIPAGLKLAVVGPSGAGKSTLLGVISGQVPVTAGEVFLNGRGLGMYDPGTLRKLTSWVGQRPYLFPGTIADNLALGQPEKTRVEIEEAARRAKVTDFAASLPKGLDTAIGERGMGISGGEAQRVALARAFLKDTPLVLFDEPTAHLDATNEAGLVETIAELSTGKMVLIATHSRVLVDLCDDLLRLEDGTFKEMTGRAA